MVTLCTSVGPSTMPRRKAPSTCSAKGISCATPSDPWSCSAPRDVVPDFWQHHLDRRNVLADPEIVLVPVDSPCRAQDHEAKGFHHDPRIRDLLLGHLLIGEYFPLGATRQRAGAYHVEAFANLRHSPHGLMDAPAPRRVCATTKPWPLSASRFSVGTREAFTDVHVPGSPYGLTYTG